MTSTYANFALLVVHRFILISYSETAMPCYAIQYIVRPYDGRRGRRTKRVSPDLAERDISGRIPQ